MEPQSYTIDKNPYFTKNLDVSTGHITQQDNKLLTSSTIASTKYNVDNCPVTFYKYEYGYFVFVPEDSEDKAIKEYGFSQEFVNLISHARRLKCKYLQLDSDGIQYEDLPTFDW